MNKKKWKKLAKSYEVRVVTLQERELDLVQGISDCWDALRADGCKDSGRLPDALKALLDDKNAEIQGCWQVLTDQGCADTGELPEVLKAWLDAKDTEFRITLQSFRNDFQTGWQALHNDGWTPNATPQSLDGALTSWFAAKNAEIQSLRTSIKQCWQVMSEHRADYDRRQTLIWEALQSVLAAEAAEAAKASHRHGVDPSSKASDVG